MPIHSCELPGGGRGWQWGGRGKCYPSRTGAEKQAAAAHAHGYAGDAVPLAAGIAAVLPDGRALFLKRGRGDHTGTWCLPGGMAEEGEDALAAARREFQEETGWAPKQEMDLVDRGGDGVDYHTFVQGVGAPFIPDLDSESVGYAWAPLSDPPQPLHPGLAETLRGQEPQQEMAGDMALDRATVRTFDKVGRLHVSLTNISKANVCPYVGREIPGWEALGLNPERMYQLYRDPEELVRAVSTFNNIPLLSKHVPVTAVDHDKAEIKKLVIGSTGTDAEFVAPYLRNSLVVWSADAIDGIEDEDQPVKELSSAYHYMPDMVAGTTPEGERYDGVMRNIIGNHVALVEEGRAGADVVVGDSKEELNKMAANNRLSRRATMALGLTAYYLPPLMAQDAKVPMKDLLPLFRGVTAKNYATQKPKIVAALESLTAGKLAQDADICDVTAMLDALERVEGEDETVSEPQNKAMEAAALGESTLGIPPAVGKEAMSKDQDTEETDKQPAVDEGPAREYLKGKGLGEDDINEVMKMMKPKAAQDEGESKPPERKDDMKDTVTKAAMDQAIAAATTAAVEATKKAQRELREAENAVRPYVGTLAVACDSAEAVYRTALAALGVKDVANIHVSALPSLLAALPVPSKRKAPVAMDAATGKSTDFAKRYPGAARIPV